ncbi:MAG TPA: hypothetical protein VF676_09705 [Flavobacterium sp.]|jgi:hypothetical protein
MKILVKFNNWAFAITAILYLTIYLGMIAQILLGPIQVISSLIILKGYYANLNVSQRRMMHIYWFAVVVSLTLIWYFNIYTNSHDASEGISLFAVPMTVAAYFIYILNKILKNHENTQEPNTAL